MNKPIQSKRLEELSDEELAGICGASGKQIAVIRPTLPLGFNRGKQLVGRVTRPTTGPLVNPPILRF